MPLPLQSSRWETLGEFHAKTDTFCSLKIKIKRESGTRDPMHTVGRRVNCRPLGWDPSSGPASMR